MELLINDLTKQYADKTAIDHVSCRLTPGITGLLGANGGRKKHPYADGLRGHLAPRR